MDRDMNSFPAPGFGRRAFLGGVFTAAGGVALGQETKPAPAPKAHGNALVYQFKIGEFDAWSISDGHMLFRGIDLMWPPEAHPEMTDWLETHGERMDGIPLYVNILVVRIGKEIAIFDAGFGETCAASFVRLVERLAAA